ncbi:MAG TPA: VWA domain-containing protein, partial [Jiangellales bacterium]|nr:VWA domain-containing protein [Jiangellales bacterium]
DNLPRSTSRAVAELAEYPWASAEARALYQQILDQLRQEVVDQRFRGLQQALADPAAQQAFAEMMRDLNDLLERHARGEDTTDQFRQFMAQHGDFFPEDPSTVDELVDILARRFAAGERLLRSLSAQQREELESLLTQAMGNGALAEQMNRLGGNLHSLRPDLNWGRGTRVPGRGRDLGYGEAASTLEEIGDLDDLIDAFAQESPGSTLDDIDVESVERNLGRDAADDVRRLRELERELHRQGYLTRGADGLTLSPKALRRLGGTALRQVFANLEQGRRGRHDLRDAGAAGEVTGASRTWEFGDEQPLDVVRTVTRAVLRSGRREREERRDEAQSRTRGASPSEPRSREQQGPVASNRGPGTPVRLAVEDFEVSETERRASAAVALLVDTSYSMYRQQRWGPMKQTALALSHLVATRYPQDALQIIGFGLTAAHLSPRDLAALDAVDEQGTNLQHALRLAGRHLRKHSDAEPVVLIVTDGEPTAHLTPDGPFFWWPPDPDTVRSTIIEVDHLTRYGASLNFFMLGEDPRLVRFVNAVARRNGGRVFSPSTEELGRYVVADYVRARQGRRRA